MTEWQSNYLQANDLRLHYLRSGGDKPPFVLVHGFTDDGAYWLPVAEYFTPDYDVIMPDARGHGFSDAPERGYTPREQAQDLKGIIDGLGLQKPLILGHSMGALTAMTFGALYPDVAQAILLEDPPAWWHAVSPALSQEELDKMHELFIQRKQQTREALIAGQRQVMPTWPDVDLGLWADSKLRLNPNIIGFREPGVATSENWGDLLSQIACPVLLITADVERGALVNNAASASLQGMIPQLKVAHIPGAGHSIHREQLDAFVVAIKAFLAQL